MKKNLRKLVVLSIVALAIISTIAGAVACKPSTLSAGQDSALTVTKGTETNSYTLAEIQAMPAQEG